MVISADSAGGDKSAAMLAAFKPLGERAGVEMPEEAAMLARALYVGRERARPPIQKLVPQIIDVLTGRNLLFRRGGDIVFRDPAERKFLAMDAETFCTWLASPQGGQVVLYSDKAADEKTGATRLVDGDLSVGQSRLVMRSIDFKSSVPELLKVNTVRLPHLNEKGEIRLLKAGYDAESRIWTDIELDYDAEMDVRDALTWLDELVGTFAWREKERDFAVWLAGLITMYGRGCFRGRAPAFFIGANMQESGKSILTKLITWAVNGTRNHKNLEEDQEEELRKYLDGVVKARLPYVNFENIDLGGRELRMPLLDTFIESSDWEMRRMGGQIIESFPNDTMVLGSANNVSWSRDIQRRSLLCDLYNPMAGGDRVLPPGAKLVDADFWNNPHNRQMLLAACWAMIREWDKAGRPMKPGRLLGSFENWARFAPSVVWSTGGVFHQQWDCMRENSNEKMGDTRSRDYRTLAQVAVEEHRMRADGQERAKFRILVRELAGIARRKGLEQVCGCLYPETSIEAVLASKDFKRPQPAATAAPVENVEELEWDEQREPDQVSPAVLKAAAEWMTPKHAATLGKALGKELDERHFPMLDGTVWSFRVVKGANPRCFEVEQVKR